MRPLTSLIPRKKKLLQLVSENQVLDRSTGMPILLRQQHPLYFPTEIRVKMLKKTKRWVCDPSSMSSQEETVSQIQAVPHSADPETGRRCGHDIVVCHKTSSSVSSVSPKKRKLSVDK
jgi:hypothetical protein